MPQRDSKSHSEENGGIDAYHKEHNRLFHFRSWTRAEKLTAIGIVVAAGAFFVPEVRKAVGLERDKGTSNPPIVQKGASPSSSQTAESKGRSAKFLATFAPTVQELRKIDGVSLMRETESGLTVAEVPPGTYGFGYVYVPLSTRAAEMQIYPSGNGTQVEIHKLRNGDVQMIAFVGRETADRLRRGLQASEKFVVYSDSWPEAPETIALPIVSIECERQRLVEPKNGRPPLLYAIDCVAK